MLEKLKSAKNKVVGTKQTTKAVDKGKATLVFVADDAESRIKDPLLKKCEEKSIKVIHVTTMKKLGEACGISVGAAAAALLDE